MQDIVGLYRHLRCWALLGWVAIFVQAENAQQSLSRDEAIDEIVADASMDRMGDKAFWQAVAENLGEDRVEVRGKIAQFFDKYLGKIKEALRTKQVFMSRVNVARLEKQMQDALSALYAEGIREAAKNRKALTGTATEMKNAATEGGEVQYSVRRTKNMTLKEQLRNYYKHDGSFKSSDAFYFGESPVILEKAGIRPGSLAMTIKDFQKSTDKKHNVPRRVLNNLYSNLQNPVFSFDANGEAGVLIDDIDGDGKPVLVAVHTNEVMDREHINLITSIYGLEHPKEWLKNQVDTTKRLTVFDKEKSERFFQSYGYEASEGNTIRPVGERIAQKTPSVKPGDQKSSRPSDTAYMDAVERGDLETAQKMVDEVAKEAMKNTKILDEDGNLLVVYHGTDQAFTVFDRAKSRANMDIQGNFFSPWEIDAAGYGPNVRKYFLNITNPADESIGYRSLNKFKGQNNAGVKAREYLESLGYDGVNNENEEYIAFYPSQIKSADPVTYDDQGNVIPLSERFNPEQEDIRYSERDTSLPSDLDLALSAADEIVDGGGDAYWASLLESDPGIAGEAEEIKRLGKQLKKTEADLAEARRNLTLTDRKLKTRGIASLAATIMQDQKAGDVNHNDVQKRITAVLTEAYQKALDQLDAGADVSDAWETVYQEGVVKAADILLRDATYSEKISYKWYTKTLGEYLGEGAREYVEDSRRAAKVPSLQSGADGKQADKRCLSLRALNPEL